MSVKICPDCKFANKGISEHCLQCGFVFQPNTAYTTVLDQDPPNQDQFNVPFIERKLPTCEHCGVETTRTRKIMRAMHRYCSYSCEFRDLSTKLIAGGIFLALTAFGFQLFNPGLFSLALYTLICFILGLGIMVAGVSGVILNSFYPKKNIVQDTPPVKESNYINCPNCHHVVLKNPRCTHCGAKM
jgi:hypothetical protein